MITGNPASGVAPSTWVSAHAGELPAGAVVLDLACGHGRHSRWLAAAGHPVLAVDRDEAALVSLQGVPGVTTRRLDLELADWPMHGERFSGVVVTNYLWRPHLDAVAALLAVGGVLIYETFMQGNERYGKPGNPDFLLQPGELRHWAVRHGLEEIDYAEGYVDQPKPAMRQAICVRRAG